MGWVNTNSAKVEKIPAGNYEDVVLYESWENPYIIRFVDVDGKVIYSEVWTEDNLSWPADKNPPKLPEIDGYVGDWEKGWRTKLQNVTADVTIKPVYILKEYAGNNDHIIADEKMTAAMLFEYLANGKSVIMSQDLSGGGKNDFGLTGGNVSICKIGDNKKARLNLNSFELTCNFDHNANSAWRVFTIAGEGAQLTLSKGVGDDGVFVVNFEGIKSNGYLFEIGPGGSLVLEAGVRIEINYTTHQNNNDVQVYGFLFDGKPQSFADYNGIYVDKTTEGKIIVTVGVTTTITENGVVAKQQ